MCRIRNCCFFFDLPRGIQLIGGGLSIFFTILLIVSVVRIEDWKGRYVDFQVDQIKNSTADKIEATKTAPVKYYNEALSMTCIINIIAVIVNGLLIFGVSRKNSYLFIPWQVFFMITLIFAGLGPILAVYYVRANITRDVPWGYFTIPIIFSGILLYFWLIVLSYGKSLKDIIEVPVADIPRRELKSSSRPENRTKPDPVDYENDLPQMEESLMDVPEPAYYTT